MKVTLPILIAATLFTVTARAQVGVGTTTPNSSAQLEVSSTSRGMLVPRMSAVNRTAIATPATGLLVYDTDSTAFLYYTGSAWTKLLNSTYSGADNLGNHTATQNLNLNGKLLTGDATNYGLWMGSNGLLVDTGTYNSGSSLAISGAGVRMMWYPRKAAFRAGQVDGTQWDDASIGLRSVGFGWDQKVSGIESGAIGSTNTVSSQQSFAAGYQNNLSGSFSMGLGSFNTVSSLGGIAIGNNNTSSGQYGIAMGTNAIASALYSVSIGRSTVASGISSFAFGRSVSTNSKPGSFIMGDTTSNASANDAANQMLMRFKGGYKLYADSLTTTGVQISAATGVLKYFNNVAANYDSRSLTDKNYVDSSLLTVTPTAWANWTTIASGPGSVTYTAGSTGRYRNQGSTQTWFQLALDVTAVADNSYIDFTLPGTPSHSNAFSVTIFSGSVPVAAVAYSSSNKVRVQPVAGAVFTAGSTYTVQVNGFYEQ